MFNVQNELGKKEVTVLETLRNLSIDHMIIATKAKMTFCEIMRCLEICENCTYSLDFVFSKMAAFKQTSAYLIYKEDFSLS